MKTNKKVQKNSVQKSEKENAVKVTALAVIPKPIMLLTPQDVPTATEVTGRMKWNWQILLLPFPYLIIGNGISFFLKVATWEV